MVSKAQGTISLTKAARKVEDRRKQENQGEQIWSRRVGSIVVECDDVMIYNPSVLSAVK